MQDYLANPQFMHKVHENALSSDEKLPTHSQHDGEWGEQNI